MTCVVLAIRFGTAALQELPKRQTALYENVSRSIFSQNHDVLVRALPVPSEHSVPEAEFALAIEKGIGEATPTSILIDVGGPDDPNPARYNIMMGVILALNKLVIAKPTLEIGLLFPIGLDEKHLYAPALRRATVGTNVRIVFATGETWGDLPDGCQTEADDIRTWFANARTNPLDLLSGKLIRRTGYYELPGSGQKLLHYYDGRKAHDEIYAIVSDLLAEAGRPSRIILDSRHSQWFRAPVLAAIQERGFEDIGQDLADDEDISMADSNALLLLPIVRTGQALTELFQRGPTTWDDRQPRVWSLLSTKGTVPRNGEQLEPVMRNGSLAKISYALSVPATPQWLLENRRLTSTKPVNPETESLRGRFTSDAMWNMILESGIAPETNIPDHRKSVGYVPDFGEIAELNGALIAAKLEAALEQLFSTQMAPQLAFLCPAEPKAVRLARSLQALAGHDTIHVDRELITLFRKHRQVGAVEKAIKSLKNKRRAKLATVFRSLSEQLSHLRSLCTTLPKHDQPHVVLLDEFGYSGRTLLGLYRLASAYDLRILCCVSLADLAASEVEAIPVPGISLYSFNYPAQQLTAA
jgi:hypothetical protein